MKRGIVLKKIFIYIVTLVIILLTIISINISNKNTEKNIIKNFNLQYELYQNKVLQGTDVVTLINKAINNNEKNKVPKDEKGLYIENDETSVKISVIFYNEQDEIKAEMETINKVGIQNFISNFNLTEFEISEIKYNSLGRVSKIILVQKEK